MATAMEARGYRGAEGRTKYRQLTTAQLIDRITLGLTASPDLSLVSCDF